MATLYNNLMRAGAFLQPKSTQNRPEIAQELASVHRDFPMQDGHRALQMYDSLYAEMMLFKLLKNVFYDFGVFRRHRREMQKKLQKWPLCITI